MAKRSKLPKYEGPLRAAPWSQIALTEENREALRRAAAMDCRMCGATGHLGDGSMVQVCACVNRSRGETA